MLKKQTLFVVGAGASFELGLPLGIKLAENIAAKLHFKFDYGRMTEGDDRFFSALQQKFPDGDILNNNLRACARIKSGILLARSIDNYIDAHKEDAKVASMGKLAIIDCIVKAEKSSKLYFDPHSSEYTFDTKKLDKTWIAELVDLLFYGTPKSNIDRIFNNLSVISFNYDRCIQQALVLALHTYYHFDTATCFEIVNKLRIIYPYGSLGHFSQAQSAKAVPFGADIHPSYLFELSKNIRTYSEQLADIELVSQISTEVENAQNIVFLGCAYHPQNINILTSNNPNFEKNIYGTALGISDDGVAQKRLRLFYNLHFSSSISRDSADLPHDSRINSFIKLENALGCFDLMQEYRHSLLHQ